MSKYTTEFYTLPRFAELRQIAYLSMMSIRCIVTGEEVLSFYTPNPYLIQSEQDAEKLKFNEFNLTFKKIPRLAAIFLLLSNIISSPTILLVLPLCIASDSITLVGMASRVVYNGFKWLLGSKAGSNEVTVAPSTDNTQIASSITAQKLEQEQELKQDRVEANSISIGAKVARLIWGARITAAGLTKDIGDYPSINTTKIEPWHDYQFNVQYQQCAASAVKTMQENITVNNTLKYFLYKDIDASGVTIGAVYFQETTNWFGSRKLHVSESKISVSNYSYISSQIGMPINCSSSGVSRLFFTSEYSGVINENTVAELLKLNPATTHLLNNVSTEQRSNAIKDKKVVTAKMVD